MNKSRTATYRFNGARFYSDIKANSTNSTSSDEFIYSLSHLYRSEFQYKYYKCIHSTKLAQNVNHHFNYGCIDPAKCYTHMVNKTDGYFLHHRYGWKVTNKSKKSIYDPIVLKYGKRLENNMKLALAHIFN